MSLFVLFGCAGGSQQGGSGEASQLGLPEWRFLGKIKTSFFKSKKTAPTQAYVFPAVRLDATGQQIDQMAYQTNDQGELFWYSPAPSGTEIQLVAEQALRDLGFQIVSFADLTASTEDHQILVFNLYYTEAQPSAENTMASLEGGWSTFVRITASTFTADLNPAFKKDLANQELMALFRHRERGLDVVKKSVTYLLEHLGIDREWSESIYLL